MTHPKLVTPDDETPIWRYMNFVKFVSVLEDDSLYFSRLDLLGDPFEGSYARNTTLRKVNIDMESGITTTENLTLDELDGSEFWAKSHLVSIRSSFVNCWYSRMSDSAAMWALYASQTDGVAIRSTVGRLKTSLSSYEKPLYIGEVNYIDYDTHVGSLDDGLGQMLFKRTSFDHEHEVRVLIHDLDHGPVGKTGIVPGLSVPVNISELISEVVVAPQAVPWFHDLVAKMMKRYGIDFEPKYSPHAATPYWHAED